MYDPTVGRWISEDPIGFESGDTNLYRYVTNRPTNLTDPSGLEPWSRRWLGWIDYVPPTTGAGAMLRVVRGQAAANEQVAQMSNSVIQGNPGQAVRQGTAFVIPTGELAVAPGVASISQFIGPTIGQQIAEQLDADSAVRGRYGAELVQVGIELFLSTTVGTAEFVHSTRLATRAPHPSTGRPPRNPLSRPFSADLQPGTYVYVQDANGVVHVAPNAPGAHPAVLGGGQSAAAAGELTIGPGGVITELNNISHTFQFAGEELPRVANVLRQAGARIAPDAIRVFAH